MTGLPALRVPAAQARRIGAWAIVAGYLVAVAGVPALATALVYAWDWLAPDPGPVADLFPAAVVLALLFSPILSWIGVILSLPVVILCRARGWIGWLPALATGLACALVAAALWVEGGGVGGADDPPPPFRDDAPPILIGGAILALAFWGTVRLLCPDAFRPAD